MGKENVAVTFKNLVQNNSRMRTPRQFCQDALALLDGRTPQIFTVEFDQVESDQHRIITVAIKHAEFSGIRVTPNVDTSVEDVDVFVEAVLKAVKAIG